MVKWIPVRPVISAAEERKPNMMESSRGFEQGPIRPPSEASSLLVRVTRNCPWNRCAFCSIYKGEKFSLRPVADVIRDIDTVHRFVGELQDPRSASGRPA